MDVSLLLPPGAVSPCYATVPPRDPRNAENHAHCANVDAQCDKLA